MKMLILQLTRSLNTSKNTFATELHRCLKVCIWQYHCVLKQPKKVHYKARLFGGFQTLWIWTSTINPPFVSFSPDWKMRDNLPIHGLNRNNLDSPHFSIVWTVWTDKKIKLDDRRDDGIPSVVVIPNYETHKASSGYFCLPNRNLTHLGL